MLQQPSSQIVQEATCVWDEAVKLPTLNPYGPVVNLRTPVVIQGACAIIRILLILTEMFKSI